MTFTTPAPFFPRLRRSQQIAEDLKSMIGSGELPAGRRIPTEAEMCRRYGVSRTTVREALQSLRSTGILDVTPGRGSYIRRPDPAPMLHELALVLNASGVSGTEARTAHHNLLRGLLTGLATSNVAGRQDLYQHVVNRQASAADNAASEARWHLVLARLAGQPLVGHFLNLLMDMTLAQRTKRFEAPENVDALAQAQMRFTTTLCEGDLAGVERLLPTLFAAPLSQAA
jgi:GntR family transcriptional repressor for pyruvate dehydrogenase complex